MVIDLKAALAQLPLPATPAWPRGISSVRAASGRKPRSLTHPARRWERPQQGRHAPHPLPTLRADGQKEHLEST